MSHAVDVLRLEKRMYIRTPRACCWVEETATLPLGRPSRTTPVPVIWAKHPWPSSAGPLLAVRLVSETVQVALRLNGKLRWQNADQLLTPRQARRWALSGF